MTRFSLSCFTLMLSAAAGCAESVIVLRDVPSELRLPLPEGTNRIVTATIKGGGAQSVWLASQQTDGVRVSLTKTGECTYQVNLASEEICSLLDPDRLSGELYIFAQTGAGRRIASLPIRYTVESSSGKQPTLHLIGEDGTEYEITGEWCVPDRIHQLELRFDRTSYGVSATATVGSESWPFDQRTFRTLRLKPTPEIQKRWSDSGLLKVKSCLIGRSPETLATLKAVPRGLALEGDSSSFTVYQRGRAAIPGTHGYLWLSLGDITAQTVLVSIITDDRGTMVERTPLRKGGAVKFTLGDDSGVLVLDEMVNLLVGEDYATFRVTGPAGWERSRIDELLAALENSDVTFIRGEQGFTGPQAATYLREKLNAVGSRPLTLDEFIDQVAGRSTMTGEPYRIRLGDGSLIDAAAWFRQILDQPPGEAAGRQQGEP